MRLDQIVIEEDRAAITVLGLTRFAGIMARQSEVIACLGVGVHYRRCFFELFERARVLFLAPAVVLPVDAPV